MNKRKLLVASVLLSGTLLACGDEEVAYGNPKGCWYDDGGYDPNCPPDAPLLDAGSDAAGDATGQDAGTDATPDALPDAAIDPTDAGT